MLSVVLLPELPDAPIVLPLLLEVSVEPLAAGELDELELVLGELPGVLEDDEDEEPLAPMEVPLLGEDEELDDGEEVLVSLLPLALGLVVLPAVPLEPEAPIVLVERSFGLVAPCAPAVPAAGELVPLLAAGELLLLELWAMARPPNARAAAAARVVRVVLVALMLNSLIDMLGNAPAWRAGCGKIRRRLSTSEVGLERQGL